MLNNTRSAASNRLSKQIYLPDWLGIFTYPPYFMRRALYESLKELSAHVSGRVLDVGCGNKPYEGIFNKATAYVGLEYDSPENHLASKADLFYDGTTIPAEDSSFDAVISTEVLEHVFNPDEHLKEVHRVLKKSGTLLLTTPFLWEEHSQPYDYGRYSYFGLKHLIEKHGFEVIVQKKLVTNPAKIFAQMTNCMLYKRIKRIRNYKIRLAVCLVTTAPIACLGIVLSWIVPNNSDYYLDNALVAIKK